MVRNGGHTNSLFILKPQSGLQDTVVVGVPLVKNEVSIAFHWF